MRYELIIMPIILIIALLCVVGMFSIVYKPIKTVCVFSEKNWDKTFDCDIIYSRLDNHWNKNNEVSGSMANIERTACSREILDILHQKYNFTMNGSCHWDCCITDGDKSGVNMQGYYQ